MEFRVVINEINETIADLATAMGQRFDRIDSQFAKIDQRFETIDQRFETIDRRFEAVDKRLETLEEDFHGMKDQLGRIEISVADHGNRISCIEEKIGTTR